MEPLIYFPTFEPPTQIWLKFALLHFENFRPIIPDNRHDNLSRDFHEVKEGSDLISPIRPLYNHSNIAYINAREDVEKFLSLPYVYSSLFNRINIRRKWENPDSWTFLVYREKFTDDWVRFCQEIGVGRTVEDGLLLPEELAFIYMAHLAKQIAFAESAAIITDSNDFDDFTNYARATQPAMNRRVNFAKGIVGLSVPADLAHIPLRKVIKFRKDNRDLIRAFNTELDNVQAKISEGYTERDFINSYNDVYSEFTRQILLLGTGIASIPFAAYMLIHNPVAKSPEYIKEILGALGIMLGGGFGLNKALKDSENRRYCKKYVTNLQRLM